jgi:hypothetical protein
VQACVRAVGTGILHAVSEQTERLENLAERIAAAKEFL